MNDTAANEQVIRVSGLLSLLMPQTSGVAIGVKGLDGRYQVVNGAMETLLGKSTEQIVGVTDADLFPPEVAAQLQHSDQQIATGAAAASNEIDLTLQGAPLRCLWLKFPVLNADGSILSIAAVIIDNTRREQMTQMQQSVRSLQQSNQELQKTLVEMDLLASTDRLTGAWNRRRLEEVLGNEMDRLRRYDHPLSLLVIDIDFFKKVNDDHGHGVGDQVLAQMAALIQSALRATDSLTRWGGEEFVVLSPNTTLSTVAQLAERLRQQVAEAEFPVVKTITISLGGAECGREETWEQWFTRADAALYRAKAGGRNQVQLAPETPARIDVGENVAASFISLSWHTAYQCGNSLIDEQHRALFSDSNQLLTAILSGRPKDEVAVLIDILIRDVAQHFEAEEAIFFDAGYPGAREHAAIHHQLTAKAAEMAGRFQDGTLAIGELFQFLASDLVARHMLKADRQFFPFLQDQEHPVKATEAVSRP